MKVVSRRVPQSREELEQWVAQIGELTRQIDEARADLDRTIAAATNMAAESVNPLKASQEELVCGVAAYAESHRDELTLGGKTKTVKLSTGTLHWRLTPPAVSLTKVAMVLAELKKRRLKRFIRTKEEVNKEALLEEPKVAATIKGVKITQVEEFSIKPNETPEVLGGKKRLAV